MQDLDEIINEARDAREVKRAVSVKMEAQGFRPEQICQILNVSVQYVSKWKGRYEVGGGAVLRLGYQGSESYSGLAEVRVKVGQSNYFTQLATERTQVRHCSAVEGVLRGQGYSRQTV